MKISKLLMMSLIALGLASCSNEENLDSGSPNIDSSANGQKTWALLNFSVGEARTRAAGIGENGNEASIGNEAAVNTLNLYIFDETGTLEIMDNYTTADFNLSSDGSYDNVATTSPLEVTSGKKTFCVVLNQLGTISATIGQTQLSDFLVSQRALSGYSTTSTGLANGGLVDGSGYMMMTGSADVTLHSGISKESVANAIGGTLTQKEANNVVSINVNRNAAKLDLKLGAPEVISLPVGQDVANPVANLSDVTYKINNLSNDTYYFLQPVDANQVYPTPFYTLTTGFESNWFDMADEYKALMSPIYMSENTHAQNNAKVGNTTYVLVKGVYVPTDNQYLVSGYDAVQHDFNYVTNSTLESGKRLIFSYEYDVAFPTFDGTDLTLSDTDLADPSIVGYIKALVAHRVAEKYTAESDITPESIVFFSNEDDYNSTISTPPSESTVYAYLSPVMSNGDVVVGHYVINMRRWSKKVGETVATIDSSFNLTPLNIGLYNTVSDGLKVGLSCFYRINVFTQDYGKAHPMYYSVMRNVSYHVSVNSVSRIGENSNINVDLPSGGNQEDPIEEATTFMQSNISVYQWVGKDMNIDDLGK